MHPSVAAFAKTLLAGTFISYAGDPLRDLTLTAFLDKFVQRKPKVQICLLLLLSILIGSVTHEAFTAVCDQQR